MKVLGLMHCLTAAGVLSAAQGAAEQGVLLEDGFENAQLGALPGGPWVDVTSRIDAATIPSPTAVVVSTIDAFGNPTQALQTVDAIGTSSGVLAEFAPVPASSLRVDVRIDQFTDVRRGATWSAAVGFLQDTAVDDLNSGPQAVVYAAIGAVTYRVFVLNDGNAFDFAIPGAVIDLGSWVTIELAIDSVAGSVEASVADPVTGQVLGQAARTFETWSAAEAQFDAVALFDGEYNAVGGSQGGQATLDNVVHTVIPAPGTAAVFAGASLLLRRRGSLPV